VIKLKSDLYELTKIDEKVKSKLAYIKSNSDININYLNEVKFLKNTIYEKTSCIFVHNLKRLIQIEGTQKNLARKIGVSEDLLSKYKSSEAFPSIETLIYICQVYNISLDMLIGTPLSVSDLEKLMDKQEIDVCIFEERYYVYFLVTNLDREGAIHEGIFEINDGHVIFKILSNDEIIKQFSGTCTIGEKLITFDMSDLNYGTAFINMIKPNINKNKYVGGSALLMLPSDANSKPCAQKIIFSKIKLDRKKHYNELKKLLSFYIDGVIIEHLKISQSEDESAYNFLIKLF
jgi:transcriptional regulator with XRE-family HTH domain